MRGGIFHALLGERIYVRRTISFYNKERLIFLLEKELFKFQMNVVWMVECRIISVSAYSTNL